MKSSLLAGRVALVTGGSRGIGAAAARALGAHGAAVAVNYRSSAAAARSVVADVEAAGTRGIAVPGDAADADDMTRVVDRVTDELGDVDVLVCNVFGETRGIFGHEQPPLLDQLDRVLRRVEIQLSATVHACRLVVPGMRRRGGGSIVVVGSTASRGLPPHPAAAEIAIAKAANDMLARTLAVELGPDGIRVNIVAPGFVATDANAGAQQQEMITATDARTPLGRIAGTDDVAEVIVGYASDLTRHVTGSYTAVDGGLSGT